MLSYFRGFPNSLASSQEEGVLKRSYVTLLDSFSLVFIDVVVYLVSIIELSELSTSKHCYQASHAVAGVSRKSQIGNKMAKTLGSICHKVRYFLS